MKTLQNGSLLRKTQSYRMAGHHQHKQSQKLKKSISKTDGQTQGTPAKNIQKRSRQRQTTSKAEMPENYEKVEQHSKRLKHVG